MLETDLWNKTRKGFGSLWRARRIEDKLSLGVPDVFFSFPTTNGRVSGMMELKCQDANKSGNIVARHYTQDQRDFATLHETVFLLLHCGGWLFLFDSTHAPDLLSGQSFDWHLSVALYSSQSPDYAVLANILRTRLLGLAQY